MKSLVLGGAGAIGSAVCRLLAARGDRVGVGFATGRNRAEALAAEIGGAAVAADVRDPAALEAGVDAFAAGEPIGALVYSAGASRDGLLLDVADADWKEVLDVNLNGARRALALCAPGMIRARSGSVVFVGSVAADRPSRGQNAYAVSKSGLECLVRLAAAELAPFGIRVNGVSAGGVAEGLLRGTPGAAAALEERVPMRRLAAPGEIASTVLFLLSNAASYVTGTNLVVDGGYSLGAPGPAPAVRGRPTS